MRTLILFFFSTTLFASGFKSYTEKIPGTTISFKMVAVKGGTFTMGSPAGEKNRQVDEGPQHKVLLSKYWIGSHEVTWDEFFLFYYDKSLRVGNFETDIITRPTPFFGDPTEGFGDDKNPAINVTHYGARQYCRWLSKKTGKRYRLPTEAEWEYAARAGKGGAYFFDLKNIDQFVWYMKNSKYKTHPVGKKKPNPWGLYDILGNVSEWVSDTYSAKVYRSRLYRTPVVNPFAKIVPSYRHIIRGGSWNSDAKNLRLARREAPGFEFLSDQDPNLPKSKWWHTDASYVGFRVVREP